jgi:two-component system, OmpR family, sensor kinase
LPIRWRLTLFNALAVGVMLLLLGLTLFVLMRAALYSDIEEAAQGRADAVAYNVESGADTEEDVKESALDGISVIVRDGSGRVLSRTADLSANEDASDAAWRRVLETGEPSSGTVELSQGGPGYVYAVPVAPANGAARVVEASKPYEPAEETLEAFSTILVLVIGTAFLLSLGGAYLLARTALRPVDVVVSAAHEMSESDLGKRLPVANPGDEIGRLTATINALLSRLQTAFSRREEALARQRRFAADASHELRTPLTSISGYARLLEEWGLADPRVARESVAAIRRESEGMRELVETLLALARGDEGAPLDLEPCDLGDVAAEAVESAQAAAKEKVTIGYSPPQRPILVCCDRSRVRQAVSVLLDNAVKYTPMGGRVAVTVREGEEWTEIEVSDTGIGIPEGQLPLVFERFHRADEARTTGGAGLGLAIARQVAEAHGGRIDAESALGGGSTFTLLLPRKRATSLAGTDLDPRTDGPIGSVGEML